MTWTAGILFFLVLLVAAGYHTLRPTLVIAPKVLPTEFPEEGFSHQSFETLLSEFSLDGRVDYEAWHGSPSGRQKLSRYLGAIAAFSPENAPERFAQKSDELAYWMYAYNALVIGAILERWPIASVTDVRAPIELVRGLGFFYKLKFVCGGEAISLYDIEHKKVIEQAEDPRVHFVLNCGSGSCPAIRPKLPSGDELEPRLAEAAAEFVADEKNVKVDHEARTVVLSKVFEWYQDDFEAELRRRGLPTKGGVLAYLPLVAKGERKKELLRVLGYLVEFRDYDWSVNATEKAPKKEGADE